MAIELATNVVTIQDAPALVPATPQDVAYLDKASRKRPWRTILRGPARSRQQEKWYRALVGVVADGVDKHPTTLHSELKCACGKVLRVLPSEHFGMLVELKSCRDMDDAEFSAYVRDATDFIFRDILPGVRRKDVFDRVYELTGIAPPGA